MKHLLIPCLLLSAASGWAMDEFSFGNTQVSVSAVWEHPFSDHVTLCDKKGTYERADRYAVQFLIEETDQRLSPTGGVLVGWDDRTALFPLGGKATAQALVADLVGGVRGHLLPATRSRTFDPSLAILGRAGVGFQDGEVDRLVTQYGLASGDLSPLRYEFGLMTEARVAIMRSFELNAGVGITWWMANESTVLVVGTPPAAATPYAQYPGYGAHGSISAENVGSETWFQVGGGWRF